MTPTTILRYPQVQAENGKFSRSTILRRIHAGLFPRPIALGPRSVGWLAVEVAAVNTALARGSTETEIRQLVRTLEARRKSVTAEEDEVSAPTARQR